MQEKKPKIIREKKGPRVLREDDYSMLLRAEKDEAAEKLRKQALKDITPVKREEEPLQAERGKERGRGGLLKRIRKNLFG